MNVVSSANSNCDRTSRVVPVAATAVGGIRDQIQDGVTGWLFPDDEENIYQGVRALLQHPEQIALAKQSLVGYTYDDNEIVRSHEKLLGLGGI